MFIIYAREMLFTNIAFAIIYGAKCFDRAPFLLGPVSRGHYCIEISGSGCQPLTVFEYIDCVRMNTEEKIFLSE